MSSLFSGLKMNPGNNPESFARCLLHAGFLLGIVFSLGDGGDMFLKNVC
jgi:hypothetical protein